MKSNRTAKRVAPAPEPDNVIRLPAPKKEAKSVREEKPSEATTDLDLLVDGRRVVIEGAREIVLRCGKASITLTRAGKIILRGTHVVSRSSGANRVQGAQVKN